MTGSRQAKCWLATAGLGMEQVPRKSLAWMVAQSYFHVNLLHSALNMEVEVRPEALRKSEVSNSAE